MRISSQSGVALVQVLLISALLLLLVVQLSKTSRNSVNIATSLKNKSEILVSMESNFSEIEFAVLTQDRNLSLSWENYSINVYGEEINLGNNFSVELQDLSGLLSPTFIGLEFINFIEQDATKLSSLRAWIGNDDVLTTSSGMRNARLPYIEELSLLNGWEGVELEFFTHVATGFFNNATAPTELLEKIYPEEVVEQIQLIRSDGKLDTSEIMQIRSLTDSGAFPASNHLLITLKGGNRLFEEERLYRRSKMLQIQSAKRTPLIEIGMRTL